MANPSYTTDLTLVANAEATTSDPGTWAELTGHLGGGSQTADQDYFIQGTRCITQSTGTKTGTECGLQYDYGSNLPWVSGYCMFTWMIFTAANAVTGWTAGGIRMGIGSTAGNVRYWNAVGSDFGRYPYGGWQNIAVDPNAWWNSTDGTDDGTPLIGQYRIVASLPNIVSAVSKGNPHGVDTIRYGRGQIFISGGTSTNYCNFTGVTAENDNQSNRWGLFQKEGAGYLWKGLLSFGGTGSTQICNFADKNKFITVDNTPRTYVDFNKIEINNTGSSVYWENINFTALSASQLSRGRFLVRNDALVDLESCNFTDLDTLIFKSRSSLDTCVFLRCSGVIQSGATITNSSFINSTSAVTLVSNNPQLISYCNFQSNGANHAIQVTSGGSYNFTGNVFTGYASVSGTTGNEMIYNTSGEQVAINVFGDGSTTIISYRNSPGSTTTIIAGQRVLSLYGLQPNTEVRIYRVADDVELAGVESSGTGFTYNYTYTSDTPIFIRIFHIYYVDLTIYTSLTDSDNSIPIQQIYDRNYDPGQTPP